MVNRIEWKLNAFIKHIPDPLLHRLRNIWHHDPDQLQDAVHTAHVDNDKSKSREPSEEELLGGLILAEICRLLTQTLLSWRLRKSGCSSTWPKRRRQGRKY